MRFHSLYNHVNTEMIALNPLKKVEKQAHRKSGGTIEGCDAALGERLGAALEGLTPEQRERRLVAEVNGKVIGYTTLGCWQEHDGRWVYLVLGWVLPEWRGKGIGTAMLHWGER